MFQPSIASEDFSQASTSGHAGSRKVAGVRTGDRTPLNNTAPTPILVLRESPPVPAQAVAAPFVGNGALAAWLRLLHGWLLSAVASVAGLRTHLEQHRFSASPRSDLAAMSERELLDIGVTRDDVNRTPYPTLDRLMHRM